jgi:hypothetical protein
MSRRKKPSRRPKSRPATRQPRRANADLLTRLADALNSGEPVRLLALASQYVTVFDPRVRDPLKREPAPITLVDFVQTLIEVDRRETSALLAATAALTDDELLAGRISRELASRAMPLPDWLTALRKVTPYRAVCIADELHDGDQIIVGARLPGDGYLTVSAYVDHNLGTVLKDALVIDRSVEEVLATLDGMPGWADDATVADLELVEARARLTSAIERGAMTYPPYETESWPGCRPILEWLCRALPEGGVGYDHREWTEADRTQIADRFFASPFGAGFAGADHRALLDDLLWYGTDYSNGDPFRWSPPKVEVLLLDWLPRKIVGDFDYLAAAPELLAEYVQFAHAEIGIRAALTDETLEAIDDFALEYLDIIRAPRMTGPAALLAKLGVYEPGDRLRIELERAVGGPEQLAALDDAPLPDEQFDPSGIQDVATATRVLTHLDEVVGPLLGAEYRTACRRLLRRLAVEAPEILGRRNAKPAISAAAIAWLIGQANDLFSYYGPSPRLQVKDMLSRFGVGSVSQRARAFMSAIGVDDAAYQAIALGDPNLLVAEQRRRICEQRDSMQQRFS